MICYDRDIVMVHKMDLGTKYRFLQVGWVQNPYLNTLVKILVSTGATWDVGTK
jgi:hypothetical protein